MGAAAGEGGLDLVAEGCRVQGEQFGDQGEVPMALLEWVFSSEGLYPYARSQQTTAR